MFSVLADLRVVGMTVPSQCKADVARYFETENRPFSLSDVTNALKNYGKTVVSKAIDELAESGILREKLYGKQKVYVYDQSRLPVFDENELRLLEEEITSLSTLLAEEQHRLKSLSNELKKVTSTLTMEEATQELAHVESELNRVESEVIRLRKKGVVIRPEDFEEVTSSRDRFTTEWRKRKRIAMDIIDAVAEGYPKSKKQLMSDVGIETDEDCGVTFPKDR
ncbi:hypothetical protein T265_09175 [Opisthorchis viverrini]|uniref:Homologous-pairing protein 2 homolog n=1 Tax=Opisthorchis viverrini TaxID=6198 RepID=A0A074Z6J7_OPIVI|nr:hypothetical protein T265_09175 [Opisthorchis viverrini]KER22806.1 hypothetical protein T265_09175 [Opisthorchis viverrini]